MSTGHTMEQVPGVEARRDIVTPHIMLVACQCNLGRLCSKCSLFTMRTHGEAACSTKHMLHGSQMHAASPQILDTSQHSQHELR